MTTLVYDDNANNIVLEIKKIYVNTVFDNNNNNSIFIINLKELVNKNNSLFVNVNDNPNVSYSINFNRELFENFINSINNTIDKVCKTINANDTLLQGSLDLSSIIVPYFLIEQNITSVELALVFDLFIFLAKYIIENIVKYQSKKNELNAKEELIDICTTNLRFISEIENADFDDVRIQNAIKKYRTDLEEIIKHIRNR